MKIAIFGGSFNPPHVGHISVAQSIYKKLGFKKMYIIPAAQNPLKDEEVGATPEQRLEMVKLAFESYGETFIIDDREIKRGGKSYSIDTIQELKKEHPKSKLSLIIGLDAFEQFAKWKSYDQILELVSLVVVTRPGHSAPEDKSGLPVELQKFVKEFDFNFIELSTGQNIQFLQIEDIEISGTDIRKKIKAGRNLKKYLPLSVERYIEDHKIYKPVGSKVGDVEVFVEFCINFLKSKKSINVRAFDLRGLESNSSEFTIVTSGTSTRHATSLAENLVFAVKEEYGVHPQSFEGSTEGRWVLVDYGFLIVHVFYDFIRQDYSIERLWTDAKEIK